MDKETIKKVLELIHHSVVCECGDRDAIWLCKHMPLDNVIEIINEVAVENNIRWQARRERDHIVWGRDQEWALITDSKEFFDSQPSWITLKINY